jgi:hypothetical protein
MEKLYAFRNAMITVTMALTHLGACELSGVQLSKCEENYSSRAPTSERFSKEKMLCKLVE